MRVIIYRRGNRVSARPPQSLFTVILLVKCDSFDTFEPLEPWSYARMGNARAPRSFDARALGYCVTGMSRIARSSTGSGYPRLIQVSGRMRDNQSDTDGTIPPQSSLMCCSAMYRVGTNLPSLLRIVAPNTRSASKTPWA